MRHRARRVREHKLKHGDRLKRKFKRNFERKFDSLCKRERERQCVEQRGCNPTG